MTMSRYQTRWAYLMKSVEAGRLSGCQPASLYAALKDADAIIVAARGMAHAHTQGNIASVQEDCGDTPERSSDSWFEEADEWQRQLYDALEQLDRGNTEGYPLR